MNPSRHADLGRLTLVIRWPADRVTLTLIKLLLAVIQFAGPAMASNRIEEHVMNQKSSLKQPSSQLGPGSGYKTASSGIRRSAIFRDDDPHPDKRAGDKSAHRLYAHYYEDLLM